MSYEYVEMIQGELKEIYFIHQKMEFADINGIKKEIPHSFEILKGFVEVEKNGNIRTDIIYKNDNKYTFDEFNNYLFDWIDVSTPNSIGSEKRGIVFDDYESAKKTLTKVLMFNKPLATQVIDEFEILSEKYPEAMI